VRSDSRRVTLHARLRFAATETVAAGREF